MQKQILKAVGLKTRTDIPAHEIFSPTFKPEHYGLKDTDAEAIGCLRDFVMAYNREVPVDNAESITTSPKAAELMRPVFRKMDREEVWILMLTQSNTPIDRVLINIGTLTSSPLDTRAIIKQCIKVNACGVILYHNHPSGKALPSAADIQQTRQLEKALKLLDINLIDHIIISDSQFYSFADEEVNEFPRGAVEQALPERMEDYFEVSFLSREDLEEMGFDAEKVTNTQMEQLARKIGEDFCEQLYWTSLKSYATQMGIPRK